MQERKKPGRRGVGTGGEKRNARAGRGGSAGKMQRKSSTPPVAAGDQKAAEARACPECGKTFRTDEAVQTHRHAAHGTAAMVVGDMVRCSECGSLVKGSHMAKHLRRMHGIV